jgi:hypothetical protein
MWQALTGKSVQQTGAAVSAYGQYKDSQAKAAELQFNADMLDIQASDVLAGGEMDSMKMMKAGKQMASTQTAGYAGQGVEVGSGTPGRIVEQTLRETEVDARQIQLNAARTAWGLRAQASQARYQAEQTKKAGRRAAIATILQSAY